MPCGECETRYCFQSSENNSLSPCLFFFFDKSHIIFHVSFSGSLSSLEMNNVLFFRKETEHLVRKTIERMKRISRHAQANAPRNAGRRR